MTQTLDWSQVMSRVPRERFIPDIIWRHDRGRVGPDLVPVDRRTDPDTWAAMVAADEPVITQVDNGRRRDDGLGFEATSSCSDRSVVREMLELLAPAPGDLVLEIGTGTGWNAALMAESGARVVSYEIDPQLADVARWNLTGACAGGVDVIIGDGAAIAAGTVFTKVIATVGVTTVPPSWVHSVRSTGRLIVPLNNSWYPPGLAVLERTDHSTATGRLAGPAAFMSLRAEATSRVRPSSLVPDAPTSVDVHPYYLTGERDAAVAIGQRTRGISFAWRPHGDGSEGVLWLYADGSWATIDATSAAPYEVEQAGPRRLVNEVVEAYRWWQGAGEPKVGDWHVIVTPDGQTITL